MARRNLYAELFNHFGQPEADSRGWHHVQCPVCGAEASWKKPKFSFSNRGYQCFGCERKGNLKNLAKIVGLWTDSPGQAPKPREMPMPPPAPKKEKPAWLNHAQSLVDTYTNHPQRFQLWQDYKPVSKETIIKHNFGVGILPGQKETRLIVPLYQNGAIVGFKGRALADSKSPIKWIAAKGSEVKLLWGFEHVPKNTRMLWICENYVDAALVKQMTGYDAISAGGSRVLTLEEMYAIRSLNPVQVVVAYDNDLVGSPHPETRERLEKEYIENWKQRNPDATTLPTIPSSRSEPIAAGLRAAGIRAYVFPWPKDAPLKADMMWALHQEA